MMKAFLRNSIYFGLPLLLALAGIGFLADGYTDAFYLKLSSRKQSSMIIGISRAEQGLQPHIFDSLLQQEYPHAALYNFAFHLQCSPYGKVYFDAIKNKLQADAHGGMFIVTVDPWCIARLENEPEDASRFRENRNFLATTRWINTKPNFSYLTGDYARPYLSILGRKLNTALFHRYPELQLHDDGWLEATPPMDSGSVNARLRNTVNLYSQQFLPSAAISPVRQSWLARTVALLKQHGDVYLVRLPVHPSLLSFDNRLYPQFDHYMDSLARQQQVPYFNLTGSSDRYSYTDGSHLWKGSGARVSEELSRMIINYRHNYMHPTTL